MLQRFSAVLLVMLVAIAGCALARTQGGTLNMAMGVDAIRLDPPDMSDNPSETVLRHIMDGLVEFDTDLNIMPALATSWTMSDDGLTYTFQLREGVAFHDGSPFNAEAVAINFNRIITTSLRRTSLYEPFIASVEATGPYTVVFTLKAPFGAFIYHLAHGAGLIQSPLALETYGADVGRNPVGTGPFKFVNWIPGDRIEVEANEAYWGGQPSLDRIVFHVVPEAVTRVFRLETGETHIAGRLPPTQVPRLEVNPDVNLMIESTIRTIYLGFNNQKPPLDDVRVRQAINYALDKELLCEAVMGGFAEPSDSPLAPATWGYFPTGGYPYNPEKAKALLADAGFGDGLKLTLWTPQGRYLQDYETAIAVQGMLADVGIDLRVEVIEWAAYIGALERGDQELYLLGWAPSTGDGDWVLRPLFHSSEWPPRNNFSFYANPEVDKRIDAGMTSAGMERYGHYAIAQYLIREDAPWAFLYVLKEVNGVHATVQGVEFLPIEIVLAKNAWIEQ